MIKMQKCSKTQGNKAIHCQKYQSFDADVPKYIRINKVHLLLLPVKKQYKSRICSKIVPFYEVIFAI